MSTNTSDSTKAIRIATAVDLWREVRHCRSSVIEWEHDRDDDLVNLVADQLGIIEDDLRRLICGRGDCLGTQSCPCVEQEEPKACSDRAQCCQSVHGGTILKRNL